MLRAFCLAHAQQHPTAFFIILLITTIMFVFLQTQLFQMPIHIVTAFTLENRKVNQIERQAYFSRSLKANVVAEIKNRPPTIG